MSIDPTPSTEEPKDDEYESEFGSPPRLQVGFSSLPGISVLAGFTVAWLVLSLEQLGATIPFGWPPLATAVASGSAAAVLASLVISAYLRANVRRLLRFLNNFGEAPLG